MSLLGILMTMKDEHGRPLSEYTDMVVDSDGEQDVATTMSLLEGFLLQVKKRFPHIKKVVFVSDNGKGYFLPYTFH